MRKMNILITGASGFIGCRLFEHLRKKHNVFNLVPTKKEAMIVKDGVTVDLRDKSRVRSYFTKFRRRSDVHAIIHLASRTVSGREIEDVDVFYDNLRITEGLVEIARLLRPKKIINFSSMAVYPNQDGIYHENSEIKTSVNSDCFYGLSKFCAENMLDFMLRKEKTIISHLRVSQVYGEGMRQDRIIPIMINELKKNNRITVFGDGRRVSNFVGIEKLLNKVDFFINNDYGGIFNIGDKNITYLKLAKDVLEQWGNGRSRIVSVPHGSRARFYLDTARIESLMRMGKNKGYLNGD